MNQVCVQLPTYADNAALPAFARCTTLLLSASRAAIDRYILPAGPTAANLFLLLSAGTDGLTDNACRYVDPAPRTMWTVPINVSRGICFILFRTSGRSKSGLATGTDRHESNRCCTCLGGDLVVLADHEIARRVGHERCDGERDDGRHCLQQDQIRPLRRRTYIQGGPKQYAVDFTRICQ